MTCSITGTAGLPDGTVLASATFRFIRTPKAVASQGGRVVAPRAITVRSGSAGLVDFDLVAGNYIGTEASTGVNFDFVVPDDASADWADCVNAAAIPTPSSYPASQLAMSGGGTAQDYAGFSTRADFVTWASGKTPAVGTIIHAGGYAYRYIGSGTAISDLAGWVPHGDVFADHFATNTTPGTTDMRAAIVAASAYASPAYLGSANYAVSDTISIKNRQLRGTGLMTTRIIGKASTIAIGDPIIQLGGTSVFTGINLGYDTITGTETEFQRAGIGTQSSDGTLLQRGSIIDDVRIDNVGTAITDYGNGEFSTTYGTIDIRRHSYAGVDIQDASRTGSNWENVYINTYDDQTLNPTYGFSIRNGVDGSIGQLNIEHGNYKTAAVNLVGVHGLSIQSLHLEGDDLSTTDKGFILLDKSSVTIGTMMVCNMRMSEDGTSVFRLGEAGYDVTRTAVQPESMLSVEVLCMEGLADPSSGFYPSYPSGRRGLTNIADFAVFTRDPTYTDGLFQVSVGQVIGGPYNGVATADRVYTDFPDLTAIGSVEFTRFNGRGSFINPPENRVRNGSFDKWISTSATVTSGTTEVANRWYATGYGGGSMTVARVQEAYGERNSYFARLTVTTAGTYQSWGCDLTQPIELVDQKLRLMFDMKAAVAGRVFDQISCSLTNNAGSPTSVFAQVVNGSSASADATTSWKTYVFDFDAVEAADISSLGAGATMTVLFTINGATADRSPTVSIRNVNLSKRFGRKQSRHPYDRIDLTAADIVGTAATLTGAETLSNKTLGTTNIVTLSDANYTLQDNSDLTKQGQFQLSGVTSGTTRTVFWPNGTGTMALTDFAQTFTLGQTFSAAYNYFGSSTATGEAFLGYGATISGATKSVEVGTRGVSGSTTNVQIGSAVNGALGVVTFNQASKCRAVTVATLPAAATVGAGARMEVSDATTAYGASVGSTVTGGGANQVPVRSDGTNWKITY